MPTSINWGKLVAQDRAKAMGVPWSEEELQAIHKHGISPEDVRAGILTPEEKESEVITSISKLRQMKKAELIEMAQGLGMEFVEGEVTREFLIDAIEVARERKERNEQPKSATPLSSEAGPQGNEEPA